MFMRHLEAKPDPGQCPHNSQRLLLTFNTDDGATKMVYQCIHCKDVLVVDL